MSSNRFADMVWNAERIGCPVNRADRCEFQSPGYYCLHPAYDKCGYEGISELPYCPKDKYTIIHGKAVWNEDLENYLENVYTRLEALDDGISLGVSIDFLERDRRKLHEEILDALDETFGSEWAKKFEDYVERAVRERLESEKLVCTR